MSTQSRLQPHAIAIPWPAQGHINPLMQLSKQLAAKGFTITFVNTDLNHLRILQSQMRLVQCQTEAFVPFLKDQGLDIRLMGLRDGLPDQSRTVSPTEVVQATFAPKMQTAVEKLIAGLMDGDPPVTCLISDLRLTFTQDLADKFGIPRVGFWTQSAASFASNLAVANGYRPPPDDSTLITCVPGAPPHKRSEVTFFLTAEPSSFLFDFATRPFKRIGEAAWILINTFDELEGGAMEALPKEQKIISIGPLVTSPFFSISLDNQSDSVLRPENHNCLEWLDTHPTSSVLYISFGTVHGLSAQQLEELALGLDASQQPFLWVIRPDLNSPNFPDGFLHRTKDRAMIVPWAPQLHVLSHPSIGGFLTHCGWNSTLESISRGIPMLGWPNFADQPLNLRCIADLWKIGLDMEADDNGSVSRVEVEKKVRQLMQGAKGSEMRVTIGKLRDAAQRATAEGGSSNRNFEVFVECLMEKSCGLSSNTISVCQHS